MPIQFPYKTYTQPAGSGASSVRLEPHVQWFLVTPGGSSNDVVTVFLPPSAPTYSEYVIMAGSTAVQASYVAVQVDSGGRIQGVSGTGAYGAPIKLKSAYSMCRLVHLGSNVWISAAALPAGLGVNFELVHAPESGSDSLDGSTRSPLSLSVSSQWDVQGSANMASADAVDHAFIAPVNGIYEINGMAIFSGIAAGKFACLEVVQLSGGSPLRTVATGPLVPGIGLDELPIPISAAFRLAAGDRVRVYAWSDSVGTVIPNSALGGIGTLPIADSKFLIRRIG